MESKVIEQKNGFDITIDDDNHCIWLNQLGDLLDDPQQIYIDTDKLPDLIAALQSFLPKKTE